MSQFYDPAVAIPTLVGSLFSCVASGLIFLSYIVLPQIPHFRHILILNLAGADFFNSLNNSISGIYLFANGRLTDGPWCDVNGFVGQMTVQGTDFSILLIAMATVFALRGGGTHPMISDVSWKNKVLVTVCVWLVPTTTAIIGLALQAYRPVSGNWCWISRDKPVLRYGLNHGWRFAIIFITITLYIYLYFYFRTQFHEIRALSEKQPAPSLSHSLGHTKSKSSSSTKTKHTRKSHISLKPIHENEALDDTTYPTYPFSPTQPFSPISATITTPSAINSTIYPYPDLTEVYRSPTAARYLHNQSKLDAYDTSDSDDDDEFAMRRKETLLSPLSTIGRTHSKASSLSSLRSSPSAKSHHTSHLQIPISTSKALTNITSYTSHLTTSSSLTPFGYSHTTSLSQKQSEVRKMLLLNAYPIAYVLLWVPGLVNRVVEMSGGSSRGLRVAQSATQWVGLANAVTYGLNEGVRRQATAWWAGRKRRRGGREEGSWYGSEKRGRRGSV